MAEADTPYLIGRMGDVPVRGPGVPLEEQGGGWMRASPCAVWSQDPVTFNSRYIPAVIEGTTMTPMPVGPIPLWFGGSAEAALKRTIRTPPQ